MSKRFYAPSDNILENKDTIIIEGDEKHHIKNVMRKKVGDEILVFNGSGTEYLCSIIREDKDKLILNIQEKIKNQRPLPLRLTLAVAIPKKKKLDYIIQKATELRVESLIPMTTHRSIIKINSAKAKDKILRWNKIAKEASKQSRRKYIPKIYEPKSFSEVLKLNKNYKLLLIACLDKRAKSIKEILSSSNVNSVLVLVGPEGGFTQEEISEAIDKNFIPVWLGNYILKIDTACMFLLSVINYSLQGIDI